MRVTYLLTVFAFAACTPGGTSPSVAAAEASRLAAGVVPAVHSDLYYAGTAQILNLKSGVSSTEEVIFERIVDSTASMITELACVKDTGRPAVLSPIYMHVTGNTLTIADSQDVDHPVHVHGTGVVAGDPWASTYLTFAMTAFGARVEDANFLVGPLLIARKQVFLPNGDPLELYDITATQIDTAEYQSRGTMMGCGATP